MPSSNYLIEFDKAEPIFERMRTFLKENPKGTSLVIKGRPLSALFSPPGAKVRDVEVEVTGTSHCESVLDQDKGPQAPGYHWGKCEIELRDKKYGGLANVELVCYPPDKLCRLAIIDADFPYPAEFDFAKQQLGLDFRERTSWCVDLEGIRHCSAREVIGGGFSHQMGLTGQAGPWTFPDLWETAKEKHPDDTYAAWRWYWEESKKRGIPERRYFTVHDREYYWTFEEMIKELGPPMEDAKEIWDSASTEGSI